MEDNRRQYAERLVRMREAKGWDQPDLARESGVSIKTISRLENRRGEPRRATTRALAKALGVNWEDLEGPPPAPLGLGVEPSELDALAQVQEIALKMDEALAQLARIEGLLLDPERAKKEAAVRDAEAAAGRSASKRAKRAPGTRGPRRAA